MRDQPASANERSSKFYQKPVQHKSCQMSKLAYRLFTFRPLLSEERWSNVESCVMANGDGLTFTAIRHVRGHVTLMAACHVSTRSAVTKCLDVTAWWVWSPRTPNPRMRDLIAGCHFRSIKSATLVEDGNSACVWRIGVCACVRTIVNFVTNIAGVL